MTRAAFTSRDIERAVRGALKGGLEPGKFAIEVTPLGRLRILPSGVASVQSAGELDDELADWRAKNGCG